MLYIRKLFILALFCATSLQAQKEYNVWYFGRHTGLNFNTTPVSALAGGKVYSPRSSSSICDKYGRLLFYTDGDTIWNRQHQHMLNWRPAIRYGYFRNQAIQGSMILPVPGKPGSYYIFKGQSKLTYSLDSAMRYWVVDMNGDNGFGEVVEKEMPLFYKVFESFAVTLHANRFDYWVAAVDSSGNNFRCIRSVNGEFTEAPKSQKITIPQKSGSKYYVFSNKFSPDSRIFAGQATQDTIIANRIPYTRVAIYQFNNATGKLSDRVLLRTDDSFRFDSYNIEFSADSRFLYCVEKYYPSRSGLAVRNLVQYDLSVWDSASIANSKVIIHSKNIISGWDESWNLQLGPDKKIYFCNAGDKWSIIDKPEQKGLACNFRFRVLPLPKIQSMFGGPYYPSFWFNRPGLQLPNDTFICLGDTLELDSRASTNDRIIWNTGDTTTTLKVWKTGTYSALLNGYYTDTIKVQVGKKFKVFIGSDTAFCGKFSHMVKAGPGYAKYSWSTGETNMEITVNAKGIYSVKVLDSNTCPSGDTVAIDEIPKPVIKISYDTITCQYVYLSADSVRGLTYQWHTGETSPRIKVTKKGWYILTSKHQFCSNSDSLLVDSLPTFKIDLGEDTTLCVKSFSEFTLSTKARGSYLWSTMETNPFIKVHAPGKYWLTVSRNSCLATDTIEVKLCKDMIYEIPTGFSPNDDQVNDVFKVYGSNIETIEIEIYNRWGEKIITLNGNDPFWDGTYNNAPCMESVYFYKIVLKGHIPGSIKYLKGTITLVR